MSEDVKSDYDEQVDLDMRLRMFIAEQMAHADIDGPILVANMEQVFQWLKHGKQSPAPKMSAVKRALG